MKTFEEFQEFIEEGDFSKVQKKELKAAVSNLERGMDLVSQAALHIRKSKIDAAKNLSKDAENLVDSIDDIIFAVDSAVSRDEFGESTNLTEKRGPSDTLMPLVKKLSSVPRKDNDYEYAHEYDDSFAVDFALKGDKLDVIGKKLKKAGFTRGSLDMSPAERETFGIHRYTYTKGDSKVIISYNSNWSKTNVNMKVKYADVQ